MKVIRQMGNGLMFEVESDTQIGLFDGLAEIDKGSREVFGETRCGCCNGDDIVFSTREVETETEEKGKKKKETFTYREMKCRNRDCRASLSFGAHKKGNTLFPKRKDENDKWAENRGWKKWAKKEDSEEVSSKKGGKQEKKDEGVPF